MFRCGLSIAVVLERYSRPNLGSILLSVSSCMFMHNSWFFELPHMSFPIQFEMLAVGSTMIVDVCVYVTILAVLLLCSEDVSETVLNNFFDNLSSSQV